MSKKVKAIEQNDSGLNTRFKDLGNNKEMTRGQFADAIEAGKYPSYHVMHVESDDGRTLRVPRSNPDPTTSNNLE